jgi:hypothetical protein
MGRPLNSKNKPKQSFGVPLKVLVDTFKENTIIFVDSMYLPMFKPRSRSLEDDQDDEAGDNGHVGSTEPPIDFEIVTEASLKAKEVLNDD